MLKCCLRFKTTKDQNSGNIFCGPNLTFTTAYLALILAGIDIYAILILLWLICLLSY